MAQTMQGHRKSVGIGAVIHFKADYDLIGRVIAAKHRMEREKLQREAQVTQ